MSLVLRDLEEFFDGSLSLPVGGKTYKVPPISATDGLWATALTDLAVKDKPSESDVATLNDDDERNLYQRMLGPVYDELIADDVAWPVIQRCGRTAFVFFTLGEGPAAKAWEAVGEAPAPNRETRRKASKGSGTRTRKRVSTAGTRSRKPAVPEQSDGGTS